MAVKTPAPQRAAGRRRLAKQKKALPDGSFPIPNVDYLGRAIRAVGRAAAGKRPALARLIRKRARQLGSAGMAKLKGSWADNSQGAKAMANAMYRQLIELNYDPELARAEVQATMTFMVREFAAPVVGSMDGPRITTASEGESEPTRRGKTKPLVSKASVHYRAATNPKDCCGTCANRRGANCIVVSGGVAKDDVCDRFTSAGFANDQPARELAAKRWDPDHDGDNDATPSGDTDNDKAGKLNPVQRAAMKRMIAKGMDPARAYKLACNVGGGAKKAA